MKESDVREYLAQQSRPVILVFNDISADVGVARRLQSDLNGTTPLTEYQISSYQVKIYFFKLILFCSNVYIRLACGRVSVWCCCFLQACA